MHAAAFLGVGGARAQGGLPGASFAELDGNLDGIVDFEEFMVYVRNKLTNSGHQQPRVREAVYNCMGQVFELCDLDRDGYINDREIEFGNWLLRSFPMGFTGSGDWAHDFGNADAKEIHRQFDRDGDKGVDLAEFLDGYRASLDELGPGLQMLEDRMSAIFARVDVDGNARLSQRELQFSAFLASEFFVQAAALLMLDTLDRNSDGTIDAVEVSEAIAALRDAGDSDREAMARQVQRLFVGADMNGDGSLSANEVMRLSAELIEGPG